MENSKLETTDPDWRPDASSPAPWRIKEPNKHYIQIVDATGNRICDFFPFAANGGRGWIATMAVAKLIVETMNGR